MKDRKKKKAENVNLKPLKQPLPAWAYVWISLGSLVIAIGLLFLYIFKAGDLVSQGIDKSVFYVLLIPMGLAAAAFLFGAMRTFASFTGRVLKGTLKIVGPGVAFFLVIILGFQLVPDTRPFSFTFHLQDSAGKSVLKNQGQVILQLDKRVPGDINAQGDAVFDIPPQFMNREVTVNLDAKGWQFTGGGVSSTCRLNGNNAVLVIERYDLARLCGTVTDEAGHLIAGAKVVVKDLAAYTDANGWFTLEIPREKQEEKQSVSVQKEGYRPYLDYAYPGNPGNLVIVLKKEEVQ